MEITIFSDLHGNLDNLDSIPNKKNLFFLGDMYSNKEFIKLIGKEFMQFYLNKINVEKLIHKFVEIKKDIEKISIQQDIPEFFKENKIITLPGNHETKKFYEEITNLPNITDLHNKKIIIKGKEFIGHGGMFSPDEKIRSENTFIYTDKQIVKNLEELKPSKGCIILMHELPIANYCKETRKVIEKIKPQIVIGGHNHQIAGQKFLINGIKYLGAPMKGEYNSLNI